MTGGGAEPAPDDAQEISSSTAPAEPHCIAPVVLDGGTRFALRTAPGLPDATPAFAELVAELRRPTTRQEDTDARKRGGLVVDLPLRDLELGGAATVAASAKVSGTRRETLTLYIEDVLFVRIGVESGEVYVQAKARALWAEGFARWAERWLDLIAWWVQGTPCALAKAHDHGWRTTGVELCCDFTGLDFGDADVGAFVGFGKNETVRKFGRADAIETLNLGTRGSPISLCIYDKDKQLAHAKPRKDGGTGGDDSCYAAMHRAHGWDGEAPRRRVEFRVTGRALKLEDPDTGEVLDFRDPALLADREALQRLWAILCSGKRLVDLTSATRAKRCALDLRWAAVLDASGLPLQVGWRQTREAQCAGHEEACRRSRRDAYRALGRVGALHDHPDAEPAQVLDFLNRTTGPKDRAAHRDYARNYRALREAFMGPEIREHGRAFWDAVAPSVRCTVVQLVSVPPLNAIGGAS